jgi:heat shock protein HtpX
MTAKGQSLKESMKRIILFVLTNLAVVVVLGIVANLLGVNRFLSANGLNLTALLGYALLMGFGGAFISLLISKPVAKWSCGVPDRAAAICRRSLDR